MNNNPLMTITEAENRIIEEFNQFDDWMDKYNLLIEMGKELPLIETKYKTNQFLITGCQSRVWLHASYEFDRVVFTADSDAVITRGIAGLLIRVLSRRKPDEIIKAKLDFIDQVGLKEHLSPTRSNGLNAMIKQMKLYALVFKTKARNKEE